MPSKEEYLWPHSEVVGQYLYAVKKLKEIDADVTIEIDDMHFKVTIFGERSYQSDVNELASFCDGLRIGRVIL